MFIVAIGVELKRSSGESYVIYFLDVNWCILKAGRIC